LAGKLERFHKTIKQECIRPSVPLSLDDARRIVGNYIEHYNTVRLHSAIGYVTPIVKLESRDQGIFKDRDKKLEEARERRKLKRQRASKLSSNPMVCWFFLSFTNKNFVLQKL
jgi:hypothetical protein